jgi:oligoribonuclease NrnB/cAMP/cGMP phosphodiesterase (DHH superfamily)
LVTSKASATKLIYLFCKANFKLVNEELEQFVEYVNAYDIWLKDTPEFKIGIVYNDIFWEYKIRHFWNRFNDDFKLRNSDKEVYRDLMKKKAKIFSKLDNSGRMFKLQEQKIFMIFLDEFKNYITLDYPNYNIYVMLSSYGGFSVRLRNDFAKDYPFKDKIVDRLLKLPNIGNAGGHNSAFGGKLIDSSAQKQIEFAKDILTIIDEEQDIYLRMN